MIWFYLTGAALTLAFACWRLAGSRDAQQAAIDDWSNMILGLVGVAFFIVLALVFLIVGVAKAAPPEGADPALAPWFQSLQTRNGGSCCSMADCLPRSYRTAGDHYEVFAGKDDAGAELWLPVPADAVLERYDNPTGRAVACVWHGQVLCFVKAAES